MVDVSENSANVAEAASAKLVGLDNVLHEYASYTYRLSLYMLSREDYTTISEKPFSWRPKNCIVAGAGKHDPVLDKRHPDFGDDFYFDELQILTMVGLNKRSKASNVLDIDFTLIEPYGLTFLDRLVVGSSRVGSKNYLDMPYLLQIEFFGHNDEGVTDFKPIPRTKKAFPIRILAMEIDVSTKGSTYKVKASPYSHGAFDDKLATTPVNLQVTASTVQEFFASKQSKKLSQSINAQRESAAVDDVFGEGKSDFQIAGLNISVDTYANGLNQWFEYQVGEKARDHPDKVIFNFDAEIANSRIVKQQQTDHKKTKLPKPGTQEAAALARAGGKGPDFNKKEFSINAGTTVEKVIDMVMRSSTYVTDQLLDAKDPAIAKLGPEEIAKKLEKNFNWYKIIPSVKLGEFDEKANRFAKIVTYNVVKYEVSDTKHPHGPKKTPTVYHKSYNYLYTGQNKDVLDFKIEFNALYYNVVTINRAAAQTSTVTPGGSQSNSTPVVNPDGGTNSPFAAQYEVIAGSKTASGLDAEADERSATINDIQSNLYQNAKADMLNVSLDIVGDPDFIKQDDVFVNPGQPDYLSNTAGPYISRAGSLTMDKGELYALVKWRTPTDIEPETGLIRSGAYSESTFSGMYRILAVKNTFRQGQFKQTVDLIRAYKLEIADTQNRTRDEEFLRGRAKPKTSKLATKGSIEVDTIGADIVNVSDVSQGSVGAENIISPVDDFGDFASAAGVSNTTIPNVGDIGAGIGGLSGALADASQFVNSALPIGGFTNAVTGAIDELSGAVGLQNAVSSIASLGAGTGSGDILQQGVNFANKFANGVGVTGAKADLMQLASFVDGVDFNTVVANEAGSPETNNAPVITGFAKASIPSFTDDDDLGIA